MSVSPIDVEVIPENAFSSCKALENIWLSDRTRVIGRGAFYGCSSLKDIHWSISLEEIGAQAFMSCGSLEVVSLPEGVVSVGNMAFSSCQSLKTLYLPSTFVRSATDDGEAFFFCNDGMGATVTCMSATPPSIKDYFWAYNNRVAQVKVPAASIDAYRQHPEWAALADRITTVEGITAITEDSSTSFAEGIDGTTDLGDTTVGDVYVTLGDEDSYDPADGSIVLGSTMDEEYAENISGCVPGQSDLANRFNGLVVMVDAGTGTVVIDCQTIGGNRLAVKTGDADAQYFTKDAKGNVEVAYNVSEPTCIYIYGVDEASSQPSAKAAKARAASSGKHIKIYQIGVTHESTGIETTVVNSFENADVYNAQGILVKRNASSMEISNLPAGIYIIKGRKFMRK